MDLLFLGEPECHRVDLVGGKVAPLSRLSADYRIPAGFCLTTASYTRWASTVHGDADARADLAAHLTEAYAELARRCRVSAPAVAVRSSAADEDGAETSFAGQYETFLNRRGIDEIVEAVLCCWSSAEGERVSAYREQQGVVSTQIRLAVLVQQLVIAATSGVVFSANPITSNRDEVVINACWGLGESVVSGTVTPDTYIVRKSDLAITTRQIEKKERMTVAVPGGTEEVAVPRLLSEQRALADSQVQEIAMLAMSLEGRFGYPIDLECAYQAGKLYLLQCRPITTLG
jgi:pyruvate,water dikinase